MPKQRAIAQGSAPLLGKRGRGGRRGRRAAERQLWLPENREKPEFEQDFFELARDFDYQRLDLIAAVKSYTFGKKEAAASPRRIEEAAGDCMAFLCAISLPKKKAAMREAENDAEQDGNSCIAAAYFRFQRGGAGKREAHLEKYSQRFNYGQPEQ